MEGKHTSLLLDQPVRMLHWTALLWMGDALGAYYWKPCTVRTALFRWIPFFLGVYFAMTWEQARTRPFSPMLGGKQLTVANLTTITVNGQRHAMTIRSVAPRERLQANNVPVLLIVHGGPGSSDIPFLYQADYLLEEEFLVVHYDQRSAGKSCRYHNNNQQQQQQQQQQNLTIQQHVDDAVAIVQRLQKIFHQEKIYVAGGSWGSVLALMLAKQHPEMFHFVAVHGTLVNGLSNELIQREFIQSRFPMANLPMPPLKQAIELRNQQRWLNRAGGVFYQEPLQLVTRYLPSLSRFSLEFVYAKHILLSPEYSWGDKVRFEACAMETAGQTLLMDEIAIYDAYKQLGGEIEIPVLFIHGRHDHMVVLDLMEGFVKKLRAPWKKLIWMEQSGHFPDREEPELFQQTIMKYFLQGGEAGKGYLQKEDSCSWSETAGEMSCMESAE